MLKFCKKLFRVKTLVTILTILLICSNIFFLLANFMVKYKQKDIKIIEPGTQFTRFIRKLEGVVEVGYLTNKDTSEESNDGEFLQAQYMLAPVVLKLNEPDNQFNILDYGTPLYTVMKLKSLNAKTVATSPYGKVLVKQLN